MDFDQAEQQFRALEASRQAGTLDDQAYREALSALRVTDDRGRVWMPQEQTGQWYVWEDGWRPGEPPRTPAFSSPPPPPPAGRALTSASAATAGSPERGGYSQNTNALGFIPPLVLWAAIIVGLAYVALTYGNSGETSVPVLLGVAAVSLGLVLWRLTRHYEGVIEKVRVEEVIDTDEDGDTSRRKVTYAYVRTLDGKTKKIQARRGYAQGDYIYKRRGDWSPRKLKA